jgi:glycosyltransferase involved in cell wall biosynthesis
VAEPQSIAVVIPTYNSARTLDRCLESVFEQTLPPTEVVVVDDVRTTDQTRRIARASGARLIISPAGMSLSRNEGVRATTSPFLVSIDSDMTLAARLIEYVADAFSKGVDAMSIPEIAAGRGYWVRARRLDKDAVEATGSGRAVRAFTRKLFELVDGYDAGLVGGEDLDFHLRVVKTGARIRNLSSTYIEHDEESLRLFGAVTKKYKYGLTLPAFAAKHTLQPLTSGASSRMSSGIRLGFRSDPLAVPGFVLLKLLEAGGAMAGRLVGSMTPGHQDGIAD